MVVPKRDELGPEVSLKNLAHTTLVPCGDHLLPDQTAPVARL